MPRSIPVTLALCAACLLLACAGEQLAGALAWRRDAILDGGLLRLWSAHLVHYGWPHAASDALALGALGMLGEPMAGSRRYAAVMAGGAGLLSLALLVCAPGLAEYRGASSLATLAAGFAGALAWRRHPRWRAALLAGLLALAIKTLWEAGGHAMLGDALPAGVAVAWQAHTLGALIGIAAGAWPGRTRRSDTGAQVRLQ